MTQSVEPLKWGKGAVRPVSRLPGHGQSIVLAWLFGFEPGDCTGFNPTR